MNIELDLSTIVQTIMAAGFLWFFRDLKLSLKEINVNLSKLNGKVAVVETSFQMHSQEDDRRFGELHDRIKEVKDERSVGGV